MFTKLLLLALFISFLILLGYLIEKRKKKVIILGDSITREGMEADGFVQLLQKKAFSSSLPRLKFYGSGVGGNKVTDLAERLENDVIHQSPYMVIILIGINDVWHKMHDQGTDLNRFIKFYKLIIEKLLQSHTRVMLCTPTTIGEKLPGLNPLDADLDDYANAIKELAENFNVPLCDVRAFFKNHYSLNGNQNDYKGLLTRDGVHLNKKGNIFLAEILWKSIFKNLNR